LPCDWQHAIQRSGYECAHQLSSFVFVLLLTAASSLCAAQTYTITDLGTLPGGCYSGAQAINVSAEITGWAYSSATVADVFLYSNGSMTNLGTLGGTTGIGNGINKSGTYRAFLSSGGTLTDIGDFGGGSAAAYALNDAGQVVGSAATADGGNHPFLYSAGKMTDLGTLGSPNGNSWWNSAQGVNNSEVVTGTSYDAHGNFFAFTWSNGVMTKMGTLGGSWSQGYAINNKARLPVWPIPRTGPRTHFLRRMVR
jgi:probable HAF family extracellular repeat protein